MRTFAGVVCVFVWLAGCAAVPPAKTPENAPPAAPPSAAPAPMPSTLNSAVLPLPEAVRAFEAERLTGTVALFDTRDGKLRCSDPSKCEAPYVPASTFKIANTIIGLETGVLEDADTPMPWDGKDYSNRDWNRDHTLRSAVQVSCVPCFKAVARKVGPQRMADWVNRLDYGNKDISGPIDFFWLGGGLRISPFQQIDFLRRLDGGKLPIQEHTLDVVRDVITLDVTPEYVLRGKTGSSGPPEASTESEWFVGFVELGDRRVFFATLIDGHAPDVEPLPARRRVTEQILRELGDLPR